MTHSAQIILPKETVQPAQLLHNVFPQSGQSLIPLIFSPHFSHLFFAGFRKPTSITVKFASFLTVRNTRGLFEFFVFMLLVIAVLPQLRK
jgi:hypothetical protein